MSRITVAHSANPWVSKSGTWIYSQVDALSRGTKYRPVVVTKRTENRSQFPFEPVFAVDENNLVRKGWERFYRGRKGYFPLHLKALKREGAKLLHSHMGNAGEDDVPLARALGVPHVTMFYGADAWLRSRQPGWRESFVPFARESALLLVEGNAMRAKLIEEGAPPEKVEVFHLGVDVQTIKFQPRAPEADGTIRLMMAGRPLEKKGHLYGLRAFAKLAPKYPKLQLELMIGGRDGKSGPVVDSLQREIGDLRLEDRIIWDAFLPYDEYLERLRRCHIFLQPSVHAESGDAEGGFPVTILEMAASGVPVVATTHCDIPEAVLEGKTGLLAPERDPDALAERLEWLVERPELWEGFGAAGRKHVEAEYNIKRQGGELEKIYDRVLGN